MALKTKFKYCRIIKPARSQAALGEPKNSGLLPQWSQKSWLSEDLGPKFRGKLIFIGLI